MTTPTPPHAAADAAAELRTALDALAAALMAGDADAVLAVEPQLHAAVTRRTAAASRPDAADRDFVRQQVVSARATLARCRALGAASAFVADATLEALGRAPSYDRHGAGPSRSLRGRGLKARV